METLLAFMIGVVLGAAGLFYIMYDSYGDKDGNS